MRIKSDKTVKVSRRDIERFFAIRAQKVAELGATQAVIYQDKNPELALARDAAEKSCLLSIMRLRKDDHVLDVGCGTGRWIDTLAPHCQSYTGIDFSKDLIEIAQDRHRNYNNISFVQLSADQINQSTLGGTAKYSLLISFGIFIYLNDDELESAIRGYSNVVAQNARILIREPVGIEERLVLKNHYSDEMEQDYNAIYRTENELISLMKSILCPLGFSSSASGNVYNDDSLNNRAETMQRWILFER